MLKTCLRRFNSLDAKIHHRFHITELLNQDLKIAQDSMQCTSQSRRFRRARLSFQAGRCSVNLRDC